MRHHRTSAHSSIRRIALAVALLLSGIGPLAGQASATTLVPGADMGAIGGSGGITASALHRTVQLSGHMSALTADELNPDTKINFCYACVRDGVA